MARPVEQVRLPEAVAQGTRALPSSSATAADFGGLAADQLVQAGAALQRAGEVTHRRAEIMATEDNEAQAKEADTVLNKTIRTTLFDPEKGYFNLKGKAALDSYQATADALEKISQDKASGIASPEARRMYSDIAKRRIETALDSMAKHASIERRQWIDGVSTARALSASDDAIAYAQDPGRREAALNVGRQEILTNAKDLNEDPEITQRKLREYDSKAYKGIVERMAVDDPMAAQQFYEENRHKIDGQQQIGLDRMLKEATGRRRAENDVNSVMGGPTGSYADKVGGHENSGRYDGTPNRSTNAGGKYQFKDDTFLAHVRNADPEFTKGKSDADLLALKKANTPEGRALQDKTFVEFTRANEKLLRDAGVPVNDSTRYLAHWFGAQGAISVLKADASKPISEFFKAGKGADGKMRSPDDWAAENGIKGMSVGQVIALSKKRMGEKTTPLPGEGDVRTSVDPREAAREIEANFASYAEQMKALYGSDPERLDKALTILKQRKSLAEEGFNAQLKVDSDKAWKIAVTPDASGRKPVSIDAIPPELWVRLEPKMQEAIDRQMQHNLKGTDAPDDEKAAALYYSLLRQAQDDPDKFRDLNLLQYRADLPTKRWDALVHTQASIVKGDAKQFSIMQAMQVARRSLLQAGFDLGEKASDKDKAVLGQFQGALQDWLTQYQEANKKPPTQADVLQQVDSMLIQGRLRGQGILNSDVYLGSVKQVDGPKGQTGPRGSKPNHVFNFQFDRKSRGTFYVPYDGIPADRRALVEQHLIARGLLKPGPSSRRDIEGNEIPIHSRRRVIEDAYGNWLADGGFAQDGKR